MGKKGKAWDKPGISSAFVTAARSLARSETMQIEDALSQALSEAKKECIQAVEECGKVGRDAREPVKREIVKALKRAVIGEAPFRAHVGGIKTCALCALNDRALMGRSMAVAHKRHDWFCETRSQKPTKPEMLAVDKCRRIILAVR
jgi:hypothetical protein